MTPNSKRAPRRRVAEWLVCVALCATVLAGCEALKPRDPGTSNRQTRSASFDPSETDDGTVESNWNDAETARASYEGGTGDVAPISYDESGPGADTSEPVARLSRQPEPMTQTETLWVPTGVRSTSAVGLTRAYPARVQVGEPFGYILTVEAVSKEKLRGVVVEEILADGFEFITSTPDAEGSERELRWSLGDLAAGDTVNIAVRGKLSRSGAVQNTARVDYVMGLTTNFRAVEPRLEISRRATGHFRVAEPIDVLYTVRNTGDGPAYGVVLNETLPAGLLANDQSSFTIDLGDIAPGGEAFARRSIMPGRAGEYFCATEVTCEGGEPASTDETIPVTRGAVLKIRVQPPKGTITAGKASTFQVVVENVGDEVAAEVLVEASLPGEFDPAPVSGGNSWFLGDLEPGKPSAVSIGFVPNRAEQAQVGFWAKAANAKGDSELSTVMVKGYADSVLSVDKDRSITSVGQETRFRIEIVNRGTARDEEVVVQCVLDAGLEYVSSRGFRERAGTTSPASNGKTTVTFDRASRLEIGDTNKMEWELVVRSLTPGDFRVEFTLSSKHGVETDETESLRVVQ